MTQYVIRRLLLNVIVIWWVASFVFIALRVLPGDFAAQQVGNRFFAGGGTDTLGPEQALEEAREELGMNDPIPVQYIRFFGDIFQGDFGRSFLTREPAIEVTGRALPYTIQLGLMSILIASMLAVPVGVISAIRQDSALDGALRVVAILGLAAPSFWTATLLTIASLRWDILELDVVNHPGVWEDPWTSFQLFLIPALAGGLASGAVLMRILRSQILDVLRQDYVRTAWAKGLRERRIVVRHVARNAMIPVVTVFGTLLGILVGGSVILEQMFNIPGMGQHLLRGVLIRDVPVVQTMTLVIAGGLVMINLLVDLSYFVIDPRVTVESQAT